MATKVYKLFWVVFSLTFIVIENAQAVRVIGYDISKAELQQLPKYLQVRLIFHYKNNDSGYKNWAKVLGPDYHHLHHFAIGLVLISRAQAFPANSMSFYSDARNQFSYVIRNSKTLPILHEVYAKRGDTNVILNDMNAAISDYSMSIKLKPTHAYAYSRLSDCYTKIGMLKEAKEVLKIMEKPAGKGKTK